MDHDKPQRKDTPATLAEISSHMLLGDRREVVIRHNGERYTLRITANGKLILTK